MRRLRKIDLERDIAALFVLVRSHPDKKIFPQQPYFLHEGAFRDWLEIQMSGYFHDLYVIEEDAIPLSGFLLAFDYRRYDSHCQITGCLPEGDNGSILGEFVHMLFREYPLNKIFMEVTDLDAVLLAAAEGAGGSKEAVFREYRFTQGAYHDAYVLSFYPPDRRETP